MSPLSFSPPPPAARDAQRGALCQPPALVREERRIGRHHGDDRAGRGVRHAGSWDLRIGHLSTNRHAVDPQMRATTVVGLHQHADGVAAVLLRHAPRGGPDPRLEAERLHAGAAAHVPLGHRPAGRGLERNASKTCSGRTCWPFTSFRYPSHVSPTTGSDQRPTSSRQALWRRSAHQGVVHHPDAVGRGEADGNHPASPIHATHARPCHLAIAVQRVAWRRRPDRVGGSPLVRLDHRHAGADRKRKKKQYKKTRTPCESLPVRA